MKSVKLILAILLAFFAVNSAPFTSAKPLSGEKSCPYKSMREAIDTITARETAHEWEQIHWRTDAAAALADAKKEAKPIFVFFVVKQKKSSPKDWVGQESDMGKT